MNETIEVNTIFEPKLEIPIGAVAPDSFDESLGLEPHDDFVVSRDRAGRPKSRYGDLMWDFTAYNPEGKLSRIHLAFWASGNLTEERGRLTKEIRSIVFSLIWRREGSPLSTGTLRNYVSVLSALAAFAEETASTIKDVLRDEQRLQQFTERGCSGWLVETLGSLLTLLVKTGSHSLGFSVVGNKAISEMKRKNKLYRAGLKQHPPMPTRIYSHFIAALQREVEEWLLIEDEVLKAVVPCAADPRCGRALSRQREIGKEQGLVPMTFFTFEDVVSEKVKSYFGTRSKILDLGSVSSLLGDIQFFVKTIVQTFTGMRDDEVSSLPFDCLNTSIVNGQKYYLVNGRTTKFAHGLVKRAQWVTNSEGHEAIKAAQRIAETIYGAFGVIPKTVEGRVQDCPLFVSVAYLGFAGVPRRPEAGHFTPGIMGHRNLPANCLLLLNDNDLRELEQIDPHRAWRAEPKFQLGNTWVFTSHQLRRSLALYAQRSGLVSLPSLRRQLKHLTESMSRYYSRGSAYATNFIGDDKDHFGFEWQSTQPESSALSYLLNVVLTDDELFGGHSAWVEHRLKVKGSVTATDRETTIKRFKRGELAYRETIIGGCTNTGTCEKVAVQWLHADCIRDNCKNLVGNVMKLQRVITAQKHMVESLEPNTVEYRSESEDLRILIMAHDAVRGKKETAQ